MQTLGVGIIGYGFIGKVHAYAYRSLPFFYDPPPLATKLVGVATAHTESARKAQLQGDFACSTDDWRKLIERDDVHIINICSPNLEHTEQLLAAMAHGKHIYCDKPLVIGADDLERIETALQTYRGIGQMTLQYRFYPATLRAKQLIEEGFLGEVVRFRASYLHSGNIDARRQMGWKLSRAAGGGVLQDLGSHIVDLMDYLIGPLHSVLAETQILYKQRQDAQGNLVDVDGEDQAVMLVKLSNNALGTIEATKIATGAEDELSFEINGTRGAIRFNLMEPNYLEAYDLRAPETPLGGERGWRKIACVQRYEKPAGIQTPKASIGWLRGHDHCLYTFLDAIATGEHAEPSLQRGLHVQRLLATAEESAATRAWKNFPLC
jgi:predicted dehydrogenase